jgi:hypothetical protein
MMPSATSRPSTEEPAQAAEKFLDLTITEMHSIPHGTLQEIHTRALSDHFAAMVQRVRFVSLGYAARMSYAGPHDGLEPLRRMCKWIIEEEYDPAETPLASKSYAEFEFA